MRKIPNSEASSDTNLTGNQGNGRFNQLEVGKRCEVYMDNLTSVDKIFGL